MAVRRRVPRVRLAVFGLIDRLGRTPWLLGGPGGRPQPWSAHGHRLVRGLRRRRGLAGQ
jgi:hypothetical protein